MAATLQGIKQRYGIIGKSPLLDRALSTAQRVSSTDLTVLIQGESGVGKEVFSRIIHDLSSRKHNKFIAINTGAIPEGTINSELFGHEKGAFTGATNDRKGYFETVNTGTIFLDEIGEMPMDTQAFLLRILESGEFIKVGSSKVLKTDIRVIAATNVDLKEKIKQGKFREDLYYRLNTVPIKVPSLKERREDIYMLMRKFSVDFAEKYRTESIKLTDDARMAFEKYNWPGNIRELRNVVEQLSVLSEEKTISVQDLVATVPTIFETSLPVRANTTNGSGTSFEEREILYKFLFEMKNDLNDVKSLVYELIRSNDLNMPDIGAFKNSGTTLSGHVSEMEREVARNYNNLNEVRPGSEQPIIIHKGDNSNFHNAEEVIESLSLEDMEKEYIKKALKKCKGRRKDAAEELGISERTLYRKINQYQIEE
jgi:DNA-binding NtrC family response regulator